MNKVGGFIVVCLICLIWVLGGCEPKTPETESEKSSEISFLTADSIEIYGGFFEGSPQSSTILLFHQGGSTARGEYADIIPRLSSLEYHVLAIDQRTGGQRYGSYNRTVANFPLG